MQLPLQAISALEMRRSIRQRGYEAFLFPETHREHPTRHTALLSVHPPHHPAITCSAHMALLTLPVPAEKSRRCAGSSPIDTAPRESEEVRHGVRHLQLTVGS